MIVPDKAEAALLAVRAFFHTGLWLSSLPEVGGLSTVVFPDYNRKWGWHVALRHHGSGVSLIQWEAARHTSWSKSRVAPPAPVTRGL